MKPVTITHGYLVTKDGKVWSLRRNRYLRTFVNNTGYELVRLSVGGKTQAFLVHRIVALAYIPVIEGKDFVNHKDRNKLNNSVGNLEWVSRQENIDHAVLGGGYGRPGLHDVAQCSCPCHNRSKRSQLLAA